MDPDEITAQTVAAFEEFMTDEERGVEPEVPEIPEENGEPDLGDPAEELKPVEEDEEEADDAEPEDEEDDDDEEPEEAEEEEEAVTAERSLEVQAYLAKYGGDVEKALNAAADLYHVVGRQGQEKNKALERVEELETELRRSRAFGTQSTPMNEEQRSWVEEAVASDRPSDYVQMAVDAAEFDLARAVCQEWAREDPFTAGRVGAQIDQIEQQIANYAPPVDLPQMLELARREFPDMPQYEEQMIRVMSQLGDGHHLVAAARSQDVNEVARGIVGIYEIAKASAVTIRSAKDKVRAEKRQNGDDVRREAVVTSASTAPAKSQTPRQTQIMPGLTLEELEAEFARSE